MNTDWIDPPAFATAPIGTVRDHACIPPNQGSDDQLNIAAPARVRPQASGALGDPSAPKASSRFRKTRSCRALWRSTR
ncbi:hypothetical protein WJ973_18355 [Achromobacter xylosoxidans]